MKGIKLMVTITPREYTENYLDFFHRHGVNNVVSMLCNGTATESVLDLLAIENKEKIMFNAMVREDNLPDLIKGLLAEMDIMAAGKGVAVFIPIDCIGGSSSLKFFVGEQPIEKKESDKMSNTESNIVMIITLVDKGNTELVMEAARSAGANGGTVVRAKGTGAEIAKFFGVSISEEKEMVYIISRRDGRDAIMKAIMEKAGANTDAHGVLFSLPVDSVVGLKAFENIE